MKKIRWVFALTSLLFGIAVTLFFALVYPHHLHFQEQYQLFLFEKSYALEVLSVPGGLADLIGRFLTQFFLYAWAGATIIAVVLMSIHLLTYLLLRTSSNETLTYLLSFIPSLICLCFLCNENALMSAPVALLIMLGIAVLVKSIKSFYARFALILVSLPVIYLIAGSHYYREPGTFPTLAWASAGVIPLFLLLPKKIRQWNPRHAIVVYPILWTVLMIIGGYLVNSRQSQKQEDIMSYDFMARHEMWNRIIQKAQQNPPRNQVAVVALNLALAERGLLLDYMFEYPQNGIAGLLPNFSNDYVSPLVTSEAFYRLGMINTAQCFLFEAQEAIPDFQKSARCYKRLAETNLINGAYEVAKKYLYALQHTLFYRKWATETLALIADEEAVNAHPVYGYLRKMRCNQDYFFGGNEVREILVRQLESNPENQIAFEYLEAACLVAKDVESATQYYSMSEPFGYKVIPSAIQQAMLLNWSMNNRETEQFPSYFSPNIVQGFKNFASSLQASNGNPATMQKSFGKTYWSYFYFHK